MSLSTLFVIASSIFTVIASFPYLIDVVRGKAKPRIAGWLVWAVLTLIASVASYVDGQVATTILLSLLTIFEFLIVIVGYKNSDKVIDKLDIVCLVGAGIGLLLWWLFNSPSIAVIATVTIDLVGALPTVVHSWRKPNEEVWQSFALFDIGSLFTLLALENWEITSYLYPLYMLIVDTLIVAVILYRKRWTNINFSSSSKPVI